MAAQPCRATLPRLSIAQRNGSPETHGMYEVLVDLDDQFSPIPVRPLPFLRIVLRLAFDKTKAKLAKRLSQHGDSIVISENIDICEASKPSFGIKAPCEHRPFDDHRRQAAKELY